MKQVLIKQPAGLGDIFFTQKIAKSYIDKGHKVIWPVNGNFLWLNEYLDDIFVDVDTDFPHKQYYNGVQPLETNDLIFIPLQDADRHHRDVKIMAAKYKMVNMDYSDWSDYFTVRRNVIKEDDLFNKLGLVEGDEYCLVLRNYGSPPDYQKFPINYQGDLKVIELDFIDGYTLFDWSKVIENASEMHLIDSSINYLIDKLTLKSTNLSLYTRRHNNFTEIDYLFSTKYNFKI